ncbi:fibronectin type III domain-containing protein [Nocardioides sp. Kera G14]|uniref:fibronectin type III domain-containing protein n=1 Tax=Nocardioides sp. Kera G14 TaxID=2884264 RepID=UPI001D115FF9|nr:fibronectin type III domain-containing protein [Nocardioides sp. Kera G14]UDY23251.1 fibronectin type III domain-containing protein [Nocardioides sp. Kera G14]
MRHLGTTLKGVLAVVAALGVCAAIFVVSGVLGGDGTSSPYAGTGLPPSQSPASAVPELDPSAAGSVAPTRGLPPERQAQPRPETAAGSGPVDTGLSRPVHGAKAVSELGTSLPAVATNAGLTSAQLEGVLRSDPTAWVSRDGRVFYKEEVPTAPKPVAGLSKTAGTAQAPYPLSSTFALHSLPGSHHTLFLDFDGVSVLSTNAWVTQAGVTAGTYAGWDPAGNGAGFTDDERAAIQGIWARVAEDYSAFDIDVTTQDPGSAALSMSTATDVDFGTHVVVTDSAAPETAICGTGGCGGVAWTNVIDSPVSKWGGAADLNEIAWIFPNSLTDMSSSVAEAAAHEAGHTFGLVHDGNSATGDSYYEPDNGDGSKVWAPIMGASYYNAISQWSKGDYPGATNWGTSSLGKSIQIAKQDDVALIRAIAGTRATPTSSIASPLAVDGTTRYRTRSTDTDTYLLGACGAGATISANGALVGPDVDLALSVVDSSGRPAAGTSLDTNPTTTQALAADPDPWNRSYGVEVPSGASSSITLGSAGGPYFAVVRPGGNLGGVWASGGYDAYASLGAYVLTQSGCSAAAAASSDAGTTSSAAPSTTPSTPSTPATSVSSTVAATTPGSMTTAPNAAPVTSSSAPIGAPSVTPRVPATPAAAIRPGRPGGRRTVVVSWVPGASGTRPISTFRITLYVVRNGHTRVLRQWVVGPTLRRRELRLAAGGRRYAVSVTAVSAVGSSPPSRRTRAAAPR